MSCGIYKITNKINGHSYIGMSKNIEKRFQDHKTKALNSTRKDDLEKVLYRAMRKYGTDGFTYEILEECSEDELKNREIYWIKYFNTYEDKNHYNETPGGDLPGSNTVHKGEAHGRAILTEDEVKRCRMQYAKGISCRQAYENGNFKDKMSFTSFQKMWHGQTWKHVMPEVFKVNPRPKQKYNSEDCKRIVELFKSSGMSITEFSKTKECYVGYGTLWKMINKPESYR